MEYIKNQKSAIPVVLLAGLLWSFGPLVVRYMDQPNLFPWQYIFTRGVTIFLIAIKHIIKKFNIARFKACEAINIFME